MTMNVTVTLKNHNGYVLENVISINLVGETVVFIFTDGCTSSYNTTELLSWFTQPTK